MTQSRYVIKLGGSLLFENGNFAVDRIEQIAKALQELYEEEYEVHIVVGGGRIARKYIDTVRKCGGTEAWADVVGIETSRNNARVLIAALGEIAYPEVPQSFPAAVTATSTGKMVVMGGLTPGQSNNAVAALMAEAIKAQTLLNGTDVDGVYPVDPREDPQAKRIPRLTIKEFEKIVTQTVSKAGFYPLFDQVALQIVARSQMEVIFFNGKVPGNITRVIKGEGIGSKIYFPD
jgi:uridylate kinase